MSIQKEKNPIMHKYTMLFKYNNKIEQYFFPLLINFFYYSGTPQIVSLAVKQHIVLCTLLSNQNRTYHKTSSKNNDWYVRYDQFGYGVLHSQF